MTEVSQAGHVPELAFENTSAQRVLRVDGDELVGARQNRIVNISILVGAGKKLVIPVSCVEQGRWSYRSAKFASAKRSLFASVKAKKMASVSRSMRDSGVRRSNQQEVWSEIGERISSMKLRSDTAAMADRASRAVRSWPNRHGTGATCRTYAAFTSTTSLNDEAGGMGMPSSLNPSMWNSIASRMSFSTSSRVSPAATHPGRSGTYPPNDSGPFSTTTMYFIVCLTS